MRYRMVLVWVGQHLHNVLVGYLSKLGIVPSFSGAVPKFTVFGDYHQKNVARLLPR